MKAIYKSRIGRAIFAFSLLIGLAITMSGTAQAQWRNRNIWDQNRNGIDDRYENRNIYDRNRNGIDDRYENRGYGGYGNQVEMNQGYQAGLNTGARDAQRRQSYNPQRSHYWREARTQAFRAGFERGYDEGFRQYAYNNGGYGGYDNRDYRTGAAVNIVGAILGQILNRP